MRAGTLTGTIVGWQSERRVLRLRAQGGTSDPHIGALVDVACDTPPQGETIKGTPVRLDVVLASATCGHCGATFAFPARAGADVKEYATFLHERNRCPACSDRFVTPNDPRAHEVEEFSAE